MTRSGEGAIRHRAAERGETQPGMARSVAYRDIGLLLEVLDAERAYRAAADARLVVARAAYATLWEQYQQIAQPALPFPKE